MIDIEYRLSAPAGFARSPLGRLEREGGLRQFSHAPSLAAEQCPADEWPPHGVASQNVLKGPPGETAQATTEQRR
jgi:hypothetical protein